MAILKRMKPIHGWTYMLRDGGDASKPKGYVQFGYFPTRKAAVAAYARSKEQAKFYRPVKIVIREVR